MLPTLSQIQAWDTEHLIEAATYWSKTANQWEDVFLRMRNQSHTIIWEGAGGDGLRQRTSADLQIVSGIADQLRQATRIARDGAGTIGAAQRRVLYAIQDAHRDGFNVEADLSVTDTRTSRTAAEHASRQAQAQAFASSIRQHAIQLVGVEHEVAAKITSATAGIATTAFPEPRHDRQPQVQAVDQHTFKQDPPPPGPPGNPFAGWTDAQMAQVATEIAHGHAWSEHRGDFPKAWTERDLAQWIYDTIKDPNTRIATSIDSGGLALLRDGMVIYIDPRNSDYGTAFKPQPSSTSKWRTPLEYFDQQTRAPEPLPAPTPGRLPPLTPGEMAPAQTSPPESAPRPVPPPVESVPAPKPAPKGGGGPLLPGGPATPLGPHIVHPPHSIPHHFPILGEDDPWENARDFE